MQRCRGCRGAGAQGSKAAFAASAACSDWDMSCPPNAPGLKTALRCALLARNQCAPGIRGLKPPAIRLRAPLGSVETTDRGATGLDSNNSIWSSNRCETSNSKNSNCSGGSCSGGCGNGRRCSSNWSSKL